MIKPENFEDYHYYKYVVFEDGDIRFSEVQWQHRDIVCAVGKRPVGAGKIKFNDKTFSFDEKGSFTLCMKEACQDDVTEFLKGAGINENESEAFW